MNKKILNHFRINDLVLHSYALQVRLSPIKKDSPENYFYRELYWGAFSRTLMLPQEIEPEAAEASQKHGLLTLKLPKIDKARVQNIRVKQA